MVPGMPRHRRPTAPLPDVFIGSQAVNEGLLTVRQLRGEYVERVIQGVYRPAWVPLTHQLKCRAANLVLPETAVVSGASAATLLGLALARADDDVSVSLPESCTAPNRSGIRLRRVRDPHLRGRPLDGVRMANPRRIAFDAAVGQPLAQATATLDALVRHGIIDAGDLRQWLATCHDNHVVAVRRAAELIDPRAESLPESVTRVHLVEAGFDVVPQYRVVVDSRVIARVDLALPELKIAIEYDGRWHESDVQRARDNERLAALRAAGWIVIVVTAELLRHPRKLVASVAAAVAERQH
jgi:very-short-patch-repair endonuclease